MSIMSNFNFEDFRQPWETGPQWELKREFIEKYKNDFPEDRLLCLAQAYSNIELLNCSYPNPVMLQIHELSKSLNACKRFRGSNKHSGSSEQSSSSIQKGKRKLLENCNKLPKMIRFCSGEEQTLVSQDNCKSANIKINLNLEESCSMSSCIMNNVDSLQDLQSINITQNNISSPAEVLISDVLPAARKSLTSRLIDDSENCLTVENVNLNSVDNSVEVNTSVYSQVVGIIGTCAFEVFIQCIRKSLMKNRNALEAIENGAAISKIRDAIVYNICRDKESKLHSPKFCCTFLIKDIVISSAKESSKKKAKLDAAKSGIDTLLNCGSVLCAPGSIKVSSLPASENNNKLSSDSDSLNLNAQLYEKVDKGLNESGILLLGTNSSDSLPSSLCGSSKKEPEICMKYNSDISFIHNFKQQVQIEVAKTDQISSFKRAAEFLKSPLTYLFTMNDNYPNSKMQYCEVFLNNILLSSALNCTKSEAKDCAIKSAVDILLRSSDFTVRVCEKTKNKYLEPVCKKESNSISSAESLNNLDLLNDSNLKNSTKPFSINKSLLDTSFQQQFVLYHNFENIKEAERHPGQLLNESAAFCQKSFFYNYEHLPSDLVKVDVILNGVVISSGTALNRKEAKKVADCLAVKKLKKLVYTVKAKKGDSSGFVVQRSQVLSNNSISNCLSETNIGCKMLKKMGWTGGGIGISGIVEPIMPQSTRYGEGLGYGNNNESPEFKERIDSLLQEYMNGGSYEDLIFSEEFSKEERKAIHEVATRYDLQSVSRGVNEARYLTVKQRIITMKLLENLVKEGGSLGKYALYDASKE